MENLDFIIRIIILLVPLFFFYLRGKKYKSNGIFFACMLVADGITIYLDYKDLSEFAYMLLGWFLCVFVIYSIFIMLIKVPILDREQQCDKLLKEYDLLVKKFLNKDLDVYDKERLLFLSTNIEEIRAGMYEK